MRILVTGSSGRVGAAVARVLGVAHDVVGVDLRPGPLTALTGDLSSRQFVERCAGRVDAIVHTAALHAPHVGVHSDAEFVGANVDATRHLLALALRRGLRRLVLTSTTSLYGDAMVDVDRAVWVTESLAPQPRDVYDRTKIAAEQACREAAAEGLPCISLRMSRSFPEPPDRIAIYRLYRGVDLRDVAVAHRLAIESDCDGYEVFNVSAQTPFREGDVDLLYRDAASVIERYFPRAPAWFASRGWRLPERIDRVYAIDRAAERLGYRPRHNFESLFQSR